MSRSLPPTWPIAGLLPVRCLRSKWIRAYAIASAVAKIALLGSWIASAEPIAPPATRVESVLRVGFTVADLERSVEFFTRVLEFEPVSERELAGDAIENLTAVFPARTRSARLRLGDEEIELTEFLAPGTGRPVPIDSRSNDLWFQHLALVVSDMDAAYARLREHRVRQASSEPQRLPAWNPDAGGIEAFYFRDPDGHPLELIAYPKGKGDPRWQHSRGRLFLGIDHTAIAVSDTDRSLAYYRDRLGLRIAGTSENWGIEQERLSGVFGAHVRITGLRASRGPGIELLEYLAPATGRPRPLETRAEDLLFWHVDLRVADAEQAHRALRGRAAELDSPAAVQVPGLGLAFTAADPDGHRLRLVGPSDPPRAALAVAPVPPASRAQEPQASPLRGADR